MATATDGAMKQGAHAGNLVKGIAQIVGGGGGGRPNMAQAGGKNPDKIPEAIAAVAGILEDQIKEAKFSSRKKKKNLDVSRKYAIMSEVQ